MLGRSPAEDPAGVHAICGVMLGSARPVCPFVGSAKSTVFAQAAGMGEKAAARRVSELMKDLELWEVQELPHPTIPLECYKSSLWRVP